MMFRRTWRTRGRILTERGQGLAVLLAALAFIFLVIDQANRVG